MVYKRTWRDRLLSGGLNLMALAVAAVVIFVFSYFLYFNH
jgi:hypothetical protein